ncbi:uncharacterized protein LOC122497884 isoform X2 [Leptopilina heterotoma]|nr:uncharacterized protein LOC122497884 isoform X2 [Leptopilina heterotoma]
MLERALTQPLQCSVDPLKNAQTWNIPIWAPEKLQAWLDKIYTSYKDTHIQQKNQSVSSKNLNIKQLKAPYIKFESYHRETKPVFLELQSWPTINFDGERGSCPFVFKRRSKKEASESKETKENWEAANVNKEKGKEMTRRPRATTRARRAEQLVSGYCEICRSEYRDLTKHLQTEKHLSFVQNEDNFLSLDRLISTGASVEAFLKLNSSNDVRKDCKLFPNGDSSLHDNTVLSEQGNKSPTENLDNFSVDEIKMVQCNGARRNLNLKLGSSHNLRTRAKHESGHLLRSKGRSWNDDDKGNDKNYNDKFEGFTIKKRAKGTIWIEEDDPNDEKSENESIKDDDNNEECNEKVLINHEEDFKVTLRKSNGHSETNNYNGREVKTRSDNNHHLSDINGKRKKDSSPRLLNGHEANENESQNVKKEVSKKESSVKNSSIKEMNGEIGKEENIDVPCNIDDEEEKECRGFKAQDEKDDKARGIKFSRRGGRSYKGRQRLSVEERLIEDNRAYYKVEVLGSKLRSSVIPPPLPPVVVVAAAAVEKEVCEEEKKDEGPSSEKPVVVRFKRVRKSELSLLSDEAESFMFGETRRDDSSEASENEQSSVLPKDSESERENTLNSINLSSSDNEQVKQEGGDDSQDSNAKNCKKRRRTQAEALIMDNVDYYKFETPGSRLRYQAPITGIELTKNENLDETNCKEDDRTVDRLLPSKPSPEIERMQFSFEAIPKSEPWYQTYQRQDEGEEFWHYFSESNEPKPFLLPYEIENFHETLLKRLHKMDGRRKSRGRGTYVGRSPRKSPRCHASTLAIMSTIIRKREQQQQHTPNLTIIDEESVGKLETSFKVEVKVKSDVDEDLKEIAKNIDEMLSSNDMQDEINPFEEDFLSNTEETAVEETQLPKGAPVNLLELLENCHDLVPCLENSSCASSDCGDGNGESPLKRRKRRKNRTGWPGNKLRRKLHNKQLSAFEAEKKLETAELPSLKEDVCERLESPIENECTDNNSKTCSHENNEEKRTRSQNTPDRRSQHSDESKDPEACKRVQNSDDSKVGKSSKVKEFSETEVSTKNNEDSENLAKEKEISCDEELNSKETEDEDETSRLGKRERSLLSEKEERSSQSKKKDSSSDTVKQPTESSSSQLSENSLANDENLKMGNRKRQHLSATSSERETLAKRLMRNNVVSSPRKRNMKKSIILNRKCRRSTGGSSETRSGVINFKKQCKARRRPMQSSSSRSSGGIRISTTSSSIIDDENCKQKSTFVNISSRTRLRRVRDGLSSENGDLDCPLSERVNSPVATPTDLQNRRSSIEFQPVVRVMKIEDQVDRDHSILSVAVASNRRLRSSGSSKSSSQPPKKRFKSGRGHFSRWLKSS